MPRFAHPFARVLPTPFQGVPPRRAIEVLEHIGTPQAQELLQTLADGAPGAFATTTAKAALTRSWRETLSEPTILGREG